MKKELTNPPGLVAGSSPHAIAWNLPENIAVRKHIQEKAWGILQSIVNGSTPEQESKWRGQLQEMLLMLSFEEYQRRINEATK